MCEACFTFLQCDIYNHKLHKFKAVEGKNKLCTSLRSFDPLVKLLYATQLLLSRISTCF